jgi:hypothetical protein
VIGVVALSLAIVFMVAALVFLIGEITGLRPARRARPYMITLPELTVTINRGDQEMVNNGGRRDDVRWPEPDQGGRGPCGVFIAAGLGVWALVGVLGYAAGRRAARRRVAR